MPKDGSFKRAVRARARESGEKYAAVRAAMEAAGKDADEPLWRWSSPAFEHDALRAHLEDSYGIRVTSMAPFDVDHPATLRIERSDGLPWVARVYAARAQDREGRPVRIESRADLAERVIGDAEILRWLELNNYPAERLAHDEPVTVLEGWAVMVTEYVSGEQPPPSPATSGRLGDLLGRLHALPLEDGAMSREGGAFGHEPAYVGRPAADVAAAMSFLRSIESGVDPKGRGKYDWLVAQVASAEDCEGLPEAFTHANYGRHSTIQRPDGELVVVAWADSGRGPRLATLGWLLCNKHGLPEHLEANVRGYGRHIRLTDEELDRLPGAVLMRNLYLACWDYRAWVAAGYTPSGDEEWWPNPEAATEIASLAVAVLRQ